MTSSGLCHICKKICERFHYLTPYNGNGHNGFWHCDEHGPVNPTVTETETDYSNRGKPLTAGMNRAERRLFKRKGRIEP